MGSPQSPGEPSLSCEVSEKHLLKSIGFAGDAYVGKTTLFQAFISGLKQKCTSRSYLPTPNYVMKAARLQINRTPIVLQIMDISGKRELERMRAVFLQGASLILLCFDLSNVDSLESAQKDWAPELAHRFDSVPILLIGLKSDTKSSQIFGGKDGPTIAAEIGATGYLECSSKSFNGVAAVFEEIIKILFSAGKATWIPKKKFGAPKAP